MSVSYIYYYSSVVVLWHCIGLYTIAIDCTAAAQEQECVKNVFHFFIYNMLESQNIVLRVPKYCVDLKSEYHFIAFNRFFLGGREFRFVTICVKET